MYKKLYPTVVTLDIIMPELDGLEALKIIKEYDPNANVVMCTAMGQEVMVRDAIIAGAKNFIVKPFKEEILIRTISPFFDK